MSIVLLCSVLKTFAKMELIAIEDNRPFYSSLLRMMLGDINDCTRVLLTPAFVEYFSPIDRRYLAALCGM